ncbi:hypothetical protein JDFnp2_9 [Fusobacterium phage JD-Fnp2]|nr:hypothetical protein JDFnp2_9 [Fusobacterium phage JD-Fnp2]UTV61117.1 hypothetical protein JDFnp5_11 [Fusobacterium phage JD-Fnp5]
MISIVLKKDGINKGINRFLVNHYNSTLSVILLSKKGEI